MISTTFPDLQSCVSHVVDNDFFLLGELHGIEQNAAIVRTLVDLLLERHDRITLAFEWVLSDTEAKALLSFLNGEIDEIRSPDFFFDSDGRVTASHIDLINYIRAINQSTPQKVSIRVFDSKHYADEATLSKNLEQIRKEVTGPLIVEMGAVHAAKRPFDQSHSAAQLLALFHRVFSVFIQYDAGLVSVEGEIFNVQESATQQMGPASAFDAIISVPLAEPAISSMPLTIRA